MDPYQFVIYDPYFNGTWRHVYWADSVIKDSGTKLINKLLSWAQLYGQNN